jgi:hypothetical protein
MLKPALESAAARPAPARLHKNISWSAVGNPRQIRIIADDQLPVIDVIGVCQGLKILLNEHPQTLVMFIAPLPYRTDHRDQ